jgi:sarcosine oxidase delta subunit
MNEEVEDVEDVEVCPYCGHERGNKFQCCGEVHWIKRSEMEDE